MGGKTLFEGKTEEEKSSQRMRKNRSIKKKRGDKESLRGDGRWETKKGSGEKAKRKMG